MHGPRQCGLAVCFSPLLDVRMLVGVVHMKPFLTLMTWPWTMNAPSSHTCPGQCCVRVRPVVLFSVTAGSQAVL